MNDSTLADLRQYVATVIRSARRVKYLQENFAGSTHAVYFRLGIAQGAIAALAIISGNDGQSQRLANRLDFGRY